GAELAQAGDVITVHAGTYRERVAPPRGGDSDAKRIVYQAAAGEKVEVKGSEIIKGWVKVQDDAWKVTLPNTFFGTFNPYADLIHGDWFEDKDRPHHTGTVYLNGEWLLEAAKRDEVLKPAGGQPLWFAKVDKTSTMIWAQFKGVNPNEQQVEINVRRTVFYPQKPGVNYLTVRGFTMRHAATPWAPPTAEQVGLIGTHWSKGWIIENNVISHSRCSGVTLGKYGDMWDNTSANSAEGYVKTIERALKNGWNKDTIGHHIVRNNTISDCEQTGICGSLGAIFSEISGNHIYNIWAKRQFEGAEMAGIKIHASVDLLIKHNRIHDAGRAMWMDWMAQGTRITGNLCYDNSTDDLFLEVNHGPYLVDNNVFLSGFTVRDWSEGGAFVHNLFAGKIDCRPEPTRSTPYHPAHATAVAGLSDIKGGDNRFYNNIFVAGPETEDVHNGFERDNAKRFAGFGLWVYDTRKFPLQAAGNVYLNGARAYAKEPQPLVLTDVNPQIQVAVKDGQVQLHLALGQALQNAATVPVTTELLGKARVAGAGYENPDGSPLKIDTDYSGKPRSAAKPMPGPFEDPGSGTLTVW
ncbi:MAG: right-handed parallel beta-helix repeat-containing protein, partial [Verrucomicrobiota bacterium]